MDSKRTMYGASNIVLYTKMALYSCTFRDQALNNVVDKLYTFFNCIMIHAARVERHISVLSHIYLEFNELNKINGVVASG